jgi:hypothetical protein
MATGLKAISGCWTRPTAIEDVDLHNIHDYIFMLLPGDRFVAYEYREGRPLTSRVHTDPRFFQEVIEYLFGRTI